MWEKVKRDSTLSNLAHESGWFLDQKQNKLEWDRRCRGYRWPAFTTGVFYFTFPVIPSLFFRICAIRTIWQWHFIPKTIARNQGLTKPVLHGMILDISCSHIWAIEMLLFNSLFCYHIYFFAKLNVLGVDSPTTSKGQSTDKRGPLSSCKNMFKKIKESGFDCVCLFLLQEFHIFWPMSFSKAVHPEINTDLIKSSSIHKHLRVLFFFIKQTNQQNMKCTAAPFRESMISLCIASLESFYQTLQSWKGTLTDSRFVERSPKKKKKKKAKLCWTFTQPPLWWKESFKRDKGHLVSDKRISCTSELMDLCRPWQVCFQSIFVQLSVQRPATHLEQRLRDCVSELPEIDY